MMKISEKCKLKSESIKIISIVVLAGIIILSLLYYNNRKNIKEKMDNTSSNISVNAEEDSTNVVTLTNNENSIIDITDNLKKNTYIGIITDIEEQKISFEEKNKKYELRLDDDINFINARTQESISLNDIKIGDVISTNTFYAYDVIAIARNISGKELEQELLKNFTLDTNVIVNILSPGIKNIDVINNQKAIVTMEFSDSYKNYFNNSETFEKKIIVDSNTKISSKSRLAYSVDTLNNAVHDIVTIVLDKNTINNEYPVAIKFTSSDS